MVFNGKSGDRDLNSTAGDVKSNVEDTKTINVYIKSSAVAITFGACDFKFSFADLTFRAIYRAIITARLTHSPGQDDRNRELCFKSPSIDFALPAPDFFSLTLDFTYLAQDLTLQYTVSKTIKMDTLHFKSFFFLSNK